MAALDDLVATWNVPMQDKVYKIEFEHGTTTGKRILRVNGKEIIRHDWQFKLVGKEIFELGGVRCVVSIDAIGIFAYEYSLSVGGKTFEKFREQQKKALQVRGKLFDGSVYLKVWLVRMGESEIRVCLEKDSMDVWVNGSKVETTVESKIVKRLVLNLPVQGEFVDEGTKTYFEMGNGAAAHILSESSGKRHIGLVHQLFVNDALIKPADEAEMETRTKNDEDDD